jgi:hypothetical protein
VRPKLKSTENPGIEEVTAAQRQAELTLLTSPQHCTLGVIIWLSGRTAGIQGRNCDMEPQYSRASVLLTNSKAINSNPSIGASLSLSPIPCSLPRPDKTSCNNNFALLERRGQEPACHRADILFNNDLRMKITGTNFPAKRETLQFSLTRETASCDQFTRKRRK